MPTLATNEDSVEVRKSLLALADTYDSLKAKFQRLHVGRDSKGFVSCHLLAGVPGEGAAATQA
jgi:hypothetical protein